MCFYLLILAYCASAQETFGNPLENFFPFGSMAGDSALNQGDELVSDPIELIKSFPFYGTNQSTLRVSFYLDSACNLHDNIEV